MENQLKLSQMVIFVRSGGEETMWNQQRQVHWIMVIYVSVYVPVNSVNAFVDSKQNISTFLFQYVHSPVMLGTSLLNSVTQVV